MAPENLLIVVGLVGLIFCQFMIFFHLDRFEKTYNLTIELLDKVIAQMKKDFK